MGDSSTPGPVSRRRLFAGAGAAGAAAAAVAALPLLKPAEEAAPAARAEPAAKTDGGYRLSAHVQRYYQTAKV